MSYNILDGGVGRADPLAEVIEAQNPDIVVLVEADDPAVVDRIASRLKMESVRAEGRKHGGAILSRWRISESINFSLLRDEFADCVLEATVVDPTGNPWPVTAVHLHPRASLEAEARRMIEINALLEIYAPFRERKQPHLLAGDFNANSPIQKIIPEQCKKRTREEFKANGGMIPRDCIQKLLDAGYVDTLHSVAGDAAGSIGSFTTQFPGQRIDYIFAFGIDPRASPKPKSSATASPSLPAITFPSSCKSTDYNPPMRLSSLRNFIRQNPSTLRLAAHLDRGRGGMRWLDEYPAPAKPHAIPDLTGWENRDLSAVWIGHATVLLRIGGKTILTDPVFSNRVGLGLMLGTLGPRRRIAPALSIKNLPPLDLILISHAHFDHLDRPSLARLDKKTPIITAPRTQDLMRDLGFRNISELRWGEKTNLDGLTITAREVVHWGSRVILDQYRGFNAYLLEAGGRRVLFGGDSAFHEFYNDIGGVDLAILGIGGYDPYIRAHASPEQAWAMAKHAGAKFLLPIHHTTFRLSHEPNHDPIQRLLQAAGPEANRIVIREIGQSWTYGGISS